MLKFGLFITLTFLPPSAFADAPKFSDYPVTEIYQGANHPAIDEGRFGDLFPERQKVLATQKVNFAGRYIIYTQRCGNNCISPTITDAKTGKYLTYVGEYYLHDKNDNSFLMEYQPNSNLLKISGIKQDIWKYPTQTYWVIDKGQLQYLNYYDFYKIEHSQVNFDKHCTDLDKNKQFNNSSSFLCNYPNKTIKDIYKKLLNNDYDDRLLHYPLPKIGKEKRYDLKNDGNTMGIHYQWLSKNSLKIDLYQFRKGRTSYIITQNNNKTIVTIHTEKITK